MHLKTRNDLKLVVVSLSSYDRHGRAYVQSRLRLDVSSLVYTQVSPLTLSTPNNSCCSPSTGLPVALFNLVAPRPFPTIFDLLQYDVLVSHHR